MYDSTFNFVRAWADLIWSFFPIFVVVLALSLFGKADDLAARSDLVLSAAVLFAEGWWKIRRESPWAFSKAAYDMIGFLGASTAIFLATVMLLAEIGGIDQLTKITTTDRFNALKVGVECISVLYAFAVRMKIFANEDFREKYISSDRAKLEYLENIAPEAAKLYDAHEEALQWDRYWETRNIRRSPLPEQGEAQTSAKPPVHT